MKRKERCKSMKAQRGVVLAVALVLLVIITLAGIVAMQGVTVQERMTIGQVQMHSAFLDSEQQVWNAAACIRNLYVDQDGEIRRPLPDPEAVELACGAPNGASLAVVVWDENEFRYNVRSARELGGIDTTGAVTPVALQVLTPGGLPDEDDPVALPRVAPYVCFGENCRFQPSAGAAASSADGTNRIGTDTSCGALGTNRPSIFDTTIVPGVVMPEGEFLSDDYTTGLAPEFQKRGKDREEVEKPGKTADIIGNPPVINSVEAWEDNPASFADYKTTIDAIIDPIVNAVPNIGSSSKTLQPNEFGVYVVGAGQTINLSSGANAMAGGLIVLDGGTLVLEGNQCFNGVVLFRDGGGVHTASGTPAVLGSVLGYSPPPPDDPNQEPVIINPALNGVPSFYYSGRAIEVVEGMLQDALGAGVVFEIVRWRAPRGLQ